jgi:hypothetical protein
MIVRKREIEVLYQTLHKLKEFYAKKHDVHLNKVNFIIQSTVIFVMIDGVHKEEIREIKELKSL